MKRIILVALLVISACAANAQRFDWVKDIDGYAQDAYNYNLVTGSMTDHDGNLYVCGYYGWSAEFYDIQLPSVGNWGGGFVAKLSPDGEVLWHKEVYGHGGGWVYHMASLGDTALMVCHYNFPLSSREWVDIFGTRYTGIEYANLVDWKDSIRLQVGCQHFLGFTTFDLEGNIIEQHYLSHFLLDSLGSPFTADIQGNDFDSIYTLVEQYLPLDMAVDSEGNVILAKNSGNFQITAWVPCDTCQDLWRSEELDTWNGGVTGQRFYVDDQWVGDNHFDRPVHHWNIQLLKLNRHMDSVLFCKFLVYDTVGVSEPGSVPANYGLYQSFDMQTDGENNIYLCGTTDVPAVGLVVGHHNEWDSINNLYRTVTDYDTTYYRDFLLDSLNPNFRIHTGHGLGTQCGYLVKYAPDGTIQWMNQASRRGIGNLSLILGYYYLSIKIDDGDSTLYLLANVQDFVYDSVLHININFGHGDTTWHKYKGATFVHLRCDDGAYLGSGNVPSPEGAFPGTRQSTLALQHNHVVMQVGYDRRLIGIDTVYQHLFPGDGISGNTLAIVRFDTEGHLAEVIDLGNIGTNNPGGCELRDSVLYLTGVSDHNIDFGDVTFYASGYEVYIAKYVDTSFMTPYIYIGPNDTGDVRITVVGDEGAIVAYPNPFRQRVTIKVESSKLKVENGVATAWLTDMQGRREEVRLVPQGHSSNNTLTHSSNQTYTLDLTTTQTFRHSGNQAILLTLTTADGKQHTIRLLKQSDIFGQ